MLSDGSTEVSLRQQTQTPAQDPADEVAHHYPNEVVQSIRACALVLIILPIKYLIDCPKL